MSIAAAVIRQARTRAGLTQSELATRMGTTQSAVARLERPGSDPRVSTLADALHVAGHRLELRPVRGRTSIDEAQVRARLQLTPRERLDAFMASQRNLARLRARTRRA
jgi:transcriptional regulator with XRE-family HTH domain